MKVASDLEIVFSALPSPLVPRPLRKNMAYTSGTIFSSSQWSVGTDISQSRQRGGNAVPERKINLNIRLQAIQSQENEDDGKITKEKRDRRIYRVITRWIVLSA